MGRTAQQRKREFFADRPFLFVVYDFEHGVTLFAGKVVNPNNDNVIQTRAALLQEPGTGPASSSVADSAVCSKLFRDFPNSLDTSNICNKVTTEGKKLTGCERIELSAKRAKTSSTTSNPSLA